MPLAERLIEPIQVSRNTVPDASIDDVLEGVTNGTLSDIICQLSSLSHHAEDMFGNLFEEAKSISTRTSHLNMRIDALQTRISHLDSSSEEVSIEDIRIRNVFKSSQLFDQQVISRKTFPKAMLSAYNQCDRPPPLHNLNPYRDDGKDGLKFYTDPNFFFDLWREEMLKDTQRVKQDRIDKKQNQNHQQQQPVQSNNELKRRESKLISSKGSYHSNNQSCNESVHSINGNGHTNTNRVSLTGDNAAKPGLYLPPISSNSSSTPRPPQNGGGGGDIQQHTLWSPSSGSSSTTMSSSRPVQSYNNHQVGRQYLHHQNSAINNGEIGGGGTPPQQHRNQLSYNPLNEPIYTPRVLKNPNHEDLYNQFTFPMATPSTTLAPLVSAPLQQRDLPPVPLISATHSNGAIVAPLQDTMMSDDHISFGGSPTRRPTHPPPAPPPFSTVGQQSFVEEEDRSSRDIMTPPPPPPLEEGGVSEGGGATSSFGLPPPPPPVSLSMLSNVNHQMSVGLSPTASYTADQARLNAMTPPPPPPDSLDFHSSPNSCNVPLIGGSPVSSLCQITQQRMMSPMSNTHPPPLHMSPSHTQSHIHHSSSFERTDPSFGANVTKQAKDEFLPPPPPPPPPAPPLPSLLSSKKSSPVKNGSVSGDLLIKPTKLKSLSNRLLPFSSASQPQDDRFDLLKSIRDGIALRKVEVCEQKYNKEKDYTSSNTIAMYSTLRRKNGGGGSLNTSSGIGANNKNGPAHHSDLPSDVASILARRVAVEMSDTDEDEIDESTTSGTTEENSLTTGAHIGGGANNVNNSASNKYKLNRSRSKKKNSSDSEGCNSDEWAE